jgi:hypothetical protein
MNNQSSFAEILFRLMNNEINNKIKPTGTSFWNTIEKNNIHVRQKSAKENLVFFIEAS